MMTPRLHPYRRGMTLLITLLAALSLPSHLGGTSLAMQAAAAQSLFHANVEGTVTDKETGFPIPGAAVLIADLGLSTSTDAGGRFAWQDVPLAEAMFTTTLTISAPGFGDWTLQGVRLHADDTLLLTADLGASPALILVPPPRSDLLEWPAMDQAPSGLEALGIDQTSLPIPDTIRVRVTGWPYCDTGRAYTVQTLDFRSYVKHVLPNEWGASWNRESLRAGAMAAKMYAWYWIARGGKWPDADVYDSTCDQVYRANIAYASTNAAVDDTWNWRLMKNNALVPTYYRAYYWQCEDAGLAGRCMGQWDSKWMADSGATWDQILLHFYLGANLSLAPPALAVPLPPAPPPAPDMALRFRGGSGAAGRLAILIDDPTTTIPGPPADVGATDFTIEWWMKAFAVENTAGAVACGSNTNWINGNVLLDRDRFSQGRKFGVSLAGGKLVFGVTGPVTDSLTICGMAPVADGNWHHVAVTRRRSDGLLQLWVDGQLDASGDGPDGDVSYPDDAAAGTVDDPYLVLGARKGNAGLGFGGALDEVRLSKVLRYTSSFTPAVRLASDVNAVAWYPLNDAIALGPCTGLVRDFSGAAGGPSQGMCGPGGAAGPDWMLADIPPGPVRLYFPLVFR